MGASTVTLSVLLVCLILSSTSTEDLQGGDPEKDEFEDYELDDLDIDEATREKQQWERVLKDQRDSGVQVEIMEESKECSRYSLIFPKKTDCFSIPIYISSMYLFLPQG